MKQTLLCGLLLALASTCCATAHAQQNLFPDGKQYPDTSHEVAAAEQRSQWMHYNTHDPTLYRDGEWYYLYGTDASWGGSNLTGAQKKRSRDLVNWEHVGTAFDGVPGRAAEFFRKNGNPAYRDNGVWAPFLHRLGNGFRLYYSAPGGKVGENFAYIGYATGPSAAGPWTDRGVVVTSVASSPMNAIDPTVVFDEVRKRLWMIYGSYQTGIYVLELDPATGGAKAPGSIGKRIAGRAGGRHGAIEGPEVTYRNGWYYLFAAYDWLGDQYNVRVGRAKFPDGPYRDIHGTDMAEYSDNVPMVLAPYRFNDHPGWRGTAHCSVYNDNGTFYMLHQGRPSLEPAMMVLHVRRMFWIDDWPVVSPERYAGVPQSPISAEDLMGKWEHLLLLYGRKPPQFHSETQQVIEFRPDGAFSPGENNAWTIEGDVLTLRWNGGKFVDRLVVSRAWDWELQCPTIVYTGMNTQGLCMWGKKLNTEARDRISTVVDSELCTIRSMFSNLLLTAGKDGALVQEREGGNKSQLWRIRKTEDGSACVLSPASAAHSVIQLVPEGNDLLVREPSADAVRKFALTYNGNGTFTIGTGAGEESKAFDVFGFSTKPGGRIALWKATGNLNQLWRIKRQSR